MPIKHRLVGIVVIVALAMILIPIFMSHTSSDSETLQLSSKVPTPPAKPSMNLVIPPQSQTIPQALPLQRNVEKELEPGEPPVLVENQNPNISPEISKTEVATLKPVPTAPIAASKTPAESQDKAKKVSNKKITPVPAQAWVVKVGSFSDKNNADNLVKKLKEKGFNAYMHASNTSQGKMLSVYVGPSLQRSLAEQTAQRLEKLFNLKGLVVKYKI